MFSMMNDCFNCNYAVTSRRPQGGCSAHESGEAIYFGHLLFFSGGSQQQKSESVVFIKRKTKLNLFFCPAR